MRLTALELRGLSTAWPNTVRLDVAALPSLVAICGPNGHGKSMLLEAALVATHRRFASRSEAVVDYARGRDAYVVSEWTRDDGVAIRTRVALDGDRRGVKAVVEEQQPDGAWRPLNSDGLTTTFDALIEQLFPSWDLTLATNFSGQGKRGGFANATDAQRIAVLAEMLALSGLQVKAETAIKAAAIVDAGRQTLLAQRDVLARDTAADLWAALSGRDMALGTECRELETRRAELAADVDRHRAARAALAEQADAHRAAVARVAQFTEQLGARSEELRGLDEQQVSVEAAGADDLKALDVGHAVVLAAIAEDVRVVEETHAALLKSLDDRIKNNETELLGKKREIREAVDATADARAQLAGARQEETLIRAAKEDAQYQLKVRQDRLAALGNPHQALDDARRQLQTLTVVPCGGAGDFADCQFLADARAAQAQIPDHEAAIIQVTTLRQGVDHWTKQIADHGVTLTRISARITFAEQRIADNAVLAGREAALASAEARIEELVAQRTGAEEAHPGALAVFTERRARAHVANDDAVRVLRERHQARLDQLIERRQRAEAAYSLAKSSLTTAQIDVDATRAAAQQLDTLEVEIDAARARLGGVDVELAGLTERRAALDRERQVFERKRAQLTDVEARLAQLDARRRAWTTNADALGRDGVQRLEIDAAGPALTMGANDLMLAGGSTRFTLELVTEIERAGGKGRKEKCELLVFDNEDGGAVRKGIAGLSGGQQVLVEEAFRSAAVIYNTLKNERPLRVCFRDETTGALDQETRPFYVAMLRRFLALGGFERLLFVTHDMSCAALADAQVLVANGSIEVVQYSESQLAKWLADVSARRAA